MSRTANSANSEILRAEPRRFGQNNPMSASLFSPVADEGRTHPLFRELRDAPHHAAARILMDEVFGDFPDTDKSFIQEFQTGGFSARVFELALFAYIQESGVEIDRHHAAPDFVLRGDASVAIEATTTNPPQDQDPDELVQHRKIRELIPSGLSPDDDEFVFQIGKAIRRKLIKRDNLGRAYWEQPHVTGFPFVIAVAPFHNLQAQGYPMGVVAQYLNGSRDVAQYGKDGTLRVVQEKINLHEHDGKTIPSGLFAQPEAADLAGVLYSNSSTVGMFNRIGTERGYGPVDVALLRIGTAYDPNPNASKPQFFGYVVGDQSRDERETFADGLQLFLNPHAKVAVSLTALPGITANEVLGDGRVLTSHCGGLQPFASKTMVFHGPDASHYAHAQLDKSRSAGLS